MSSLARPVVAIVDDDLGVRESLRFLLEIVGYEVETYESGHQFLARADRERVGCLILDQQMPGIPGLDLLTRLRDGGMAPPTLLIVSTPGPVVSRRAAELGVFRVLEKPLAQEDLLGQVQAALV